MDLGSILQTAPGSCSLGDVLHILPSAAREGLVAALKSGSSLSDARLSCRALRDLIDFQQTRVAIYTNSVSYRELVALCQEGRWLRRLPRCTQVELTVDHETKDALAVPFLAAPPEACQRITDLTVSTDEAETTLPGKDVLALLSRLPGLCKLELSAVAPDEDDPLDLRLVQMALSMLPRLTDLTANWSYLACIPSSLAGQLTRLELTSKDCPHRLAAAEVAAALANMTSLQELSLESEGAEDLTPPEVLELLDAVPPSLNGMSLDPIRCYTDALEPFSLRATFSHGLLDTIHIGGLWPTAYRLLAPVLAAMVLPSRALGPRLSLLELSELGAEHPLPDPDRGPAATLLARCAKVAIGKLVGGAYATTESGMLLVHQVGVPESVKWYVAYHIWVTVRLTPLEAGLTARPLTLTSAAVVERAVARMAASAAEPGRASTVLLRGPFIQGLVLLPAALKVTVQNLSAAAACSSTDYIARYEAVPSAGAVTLVCSSGQAAEAVAAAARWLAAAASGNGGGVASGGGDGGVGVVLEAVCTRLSLSSAVDQVRLRGWQVGAH